MLNKLTGAFSFASVTACIFCFIFFFGYSSNVLQASWIFSRKKENVSNCRKYSRYGQRVAKYMGKVQRLFTAWKWKSYFLDAVHRSIMTFLKHTLINFWEFRINASSEYGNIFFICVLENVMGFEYLIEKWYLIL